ncbi:hypothetical protein KFK09_009393 [Dendrobium nobile]|uniref:Enoyl reductase (ER) domain-containing protein n=1 Tax=Dendrobium nobile TaxID=94219 RepID=A0A8T3BMQ3_DENNO|nr:hypothetical protein KFK09_009393 [Dendrobium nobile]
MRGFWRRSDATAAAAALWKFRTLSTATACRAVVLPRFGGPEVLEFRSSVEVPDLKPQEVLVRARAISINPLDLRVRSGYGRSIFEPLLPLILGRDVSGEVVAVGASVSSLVIGQEVFGALHPTAVRGTYADYCILSEEELSVKPSSVSHVKLLVLGGGGAVGLSAIQLAVAAGCSVSTICGSKSIERVMEVGAEEAIDYKTEDIHLAIKCQFDAVLDTIGGPEAERIGVHLLKKGGHYMTLQGEAASFADRYGLVIGLPAATAILLKKKLQYRYSHGIEYGWTYMRADAEGLDEVRRLLEVGKMKIPVEKTFSIAEVRQAHEAKEKRLVHGKVVLELD